MRSEKYLVVRRDGSVPKWPKFVLGARDPAAPAALRAYAAQAEKLGMDAEYVSTVHDMADAFERYRLAFGNGDSDRGRHRIDDPATAVQMRKGQDVMTDAELRSQSGASRDHLRRNSWKSSD